MLNDVTIASCDLSVNGLSNNFDLHLFIYSATLDHNILQHQEW